MSVDNGFLFGADVLGGLFPLSPLLFVGALHFAFFRRNIVDRGDIGEKRLQREIILLADFVELVVVAARAFHGLPQHDLTDRIGDVGGDLVLALHQVARVTVIRKLRHETGGDQSLLRRPATTRRRPIVPGESGYTACPD